MITATIADKPINIDKQSSVPLRSQIRGALAGLIVGGELSAGTRLPSVRDFAEQLEVSTITVSHAYQDLSRSGLIVSEVGKGTSVAWASPPPEEGGRREVVEWWASSLGTYVRAPRTTMLREILATGAAANQTMLTDSHPDISMKLGQGYAQAMRAAAKGGDEELLRPESALGLPELRRVLANWLTSDHPSIPNGTVREEQVLVTSGEFTALRSIATTFVGPRDSVIVEHPTYFRALDLFEERGATLLMAPTDELGIRTDVIASILRARHPKLIYLTHRLHNPSGVALHPDRQRALLALAAEHHVPVVEDDSGSAYWFDGHLPPSLLSMDRLGMVIHVGSLTRLITAGVRLGYVVASGLLLKRLAASILASDMWSAPFLQRAAANYLSSPSFDRDLRASVNAARDRRDAVLETLQQHAPEGVQWSMPVGGFNVWISFPSRTPQDLLLEAGRRAGVAVLPDSMFRVEELTSPSVRLSFARHDPTVLRGAVRRLCEAWREVLRPDDPRPDVSSGAIMA